MSKNYKTEENKDIEKKTSRDSKFNVNKDNEKRTYNGIVFSSALEMRYYRDIVLPQSESGDIVYFELQKPYVLQPGFRHDDKKVLPIVYVADFFVRYKDGSEVVYDTKGFADSSALLKRKLFWYVFPDIDYRWICYSAIDGGWCDYEYVKKQRAARKKAKKEALKMQSEGLQETDLEAGSIKKSTKTRKKKKELKENGKEE